MADHSPGGGPEASEVTTAQEGDSLLLAEESEALADADSELRSLQMGPGQHAERLDRALVELVPEFSRSYLQQLLAQGLVSLNGKPALKAAARVKAGDLVVLEMRPTLQSQAFRPEPMAIDVVYEDEHLLVVNKPAGLVVHPAPGNWSGTLLNGLLARDDKALRVPRAGIVHRLDKDTSGLMVVARDRATMDALVALIAERKVKRQYVAMAHGAWMGGDPLGGCPHRAGPSQSPAHGGGGLGGTPWQNRPHGFPVSGGKRAWLLGAVHLAHRAHAPDSRAHGVSAPSFGGRCLVRWRTGRRLATPGPARLPVGFCASGDGDPLEFRAPVPDDIRRALSEWGLGYNAP